MTIEPGHGSVALIHGDTGTAYQRFFSDGLWHGTNGKVKAWEDLCREDDSPLIVHEVTA